MIDRAKRLDSARAFASQATLGRQPGSLSRRLNQGAQKIRRETRDVAGNDKIPVFFGMKQRGVDSPHGAASLHCIGDDRQTERSVFFRVADEGNVPGGLPDRMGNLFRQRPRSSRQESLVAPHAAAAPSHKHESGSLSCAGPASAFHEKMLTIASGDRFPWANRKVYICFILALMILAASPLSAANGGASAAMSAESGALAPAPSVSARKTFVVRVDRSTGRLVRREQAPTRPAAKAPIKTAPPAIARLVDQTSRAHGVDPLLVHSVIQVESNYDPQAISPKGAEGLMQLTPPTARMLGVSNTFDPGENIEAGVKYLKYLQDLYKDDRLALAAYNAGPGAVEKYKTIPPYPETRKYVEKVGQKYDAAKAATLVDSAAEGPPSAKTDPPAEQERYSRVEQFVDKDGRLHLQAAP